MNAGTQFVARQQFPQHTIQLARFAPHHRRALADLKSLSGKIDVVLEFRDCRAPLTSINPLVSQVLPGIPKLVVYSKWDCSKVKESKLRQLHLDSKYFPLCVHERKDIRRLRKELIQVADEQKPRPPWGLRVALVGFPNVGKSSLINEFRSMLRGSSARKVASTGSRAGTTRALSEQIRISDSPPIYVLDTPGIMVPQVHSWEHMLKLCLIGAVSHTHVNPVVLADYLLFHINKTYERGGKYPGPLSNDIETVLWSLANTRRRKPSRDTWDPNKVAIEWVQRFICGEHVHLNLDDMSPENIEHELALSYKQHDLNELLPPSFKRTSRLGPRL